MKRFMLIPALVFACVCGAQSVSLVELTDMYGNEEVSLMAADELRALKGEIQAETAAFPKAFSAVKKEWEAQAKASEAKDYPKFADPKMSPRTIKTKGPFSQKQGETELEKKKIRIEREHAARAEAEKEKTKAAKAKITSAATDNKKDKMQAKDDMREAVKKRIGDMIEAEMEKMLERPVPKIFIVNAAAGMSEEQQKEKEKQDARLQAARDKDKNKDRK